MGHHLDHEIRHKSLVLILGGGGGSGLAHFGTFSILEQLGISPALIVGSSMGSIVGAIRAIQKDYDPINVGLALPKDIDYHTLFQPFTGYSRFGFPGAFHLNLKRISNKVFAEIYS